MHESNLILTITSALTIGLVLGYITNHLRLSPIVGYLLAGLALGPFTPGFIADHQIAEQFAEIGVILLMFGVGLHFHLDDLIAVRKIAVPGAITQILAATILGALTAYAFGWSWDSGIVFGLCLSVASTVVLIRVLVDNRQLRSSTGHVAVGWLIVEDLFTVIVLVVLPLVFGNNDPDTSLSYSLLLLVLKIIALIVIMYFLSKIIPWIFTQVARSSSQELFTLTILVTALGIAVASATFFDVSMALGAFLAGMTVGRSEFSHRAASEVLPLRDAFAVLFFVSVGMLLDPSILIEHTPLVLTTVTVVIIGKTLAAFCIVLVLGYPIKTALGVSVALAQIGEFSFILATLGKQLGLLDDLALNLLVATAIISITLNPILFRMVPRAERWINKRPRLQRMLSIRQNKQQSQQLDSQQAQTTNLKDHTIIIGYGPIGKMVNKIMQENGIASVVIELNLDTTQKLLSENTTAIYGDASRKEILEGAGVFSARTLIITSSSAANPEEIVRLAKEINPAIRIVARTAHLRELITLKRAGCEAVFSGEGEVALALIEEVLNNLGATTAQVRRERLRVRKEIINKGLDIS